MVFPKYISDHDRAVLSKGHAVTEEHIVIQNVLVHEKEVLIGMFMSSSGFRSSCPPVQPYQNVHMFTQSSNKQCIFE